jgi:hypothetical protein
MRPTFFLRFFFADIESGILTMSDIVQSVQTLKDRSEATESKLNTKFQIVENERKKLSSLMNEIQSELQMSMFFGFYKHFTKLQ